MAIIGTAVTAKHLIVDFVESRHQVWARSHVLLIFQEHSCAVSIFSDAVGVVPLRLRQVLPFSANVKGELSACDPYDCGHSGSPGRSIQCVGAHGRLKLPLRQRAV